MKRYKKYIMPYKSAFICGPILMLTEVAGEIALPKMMSLIINNGVANKDMGYIIWMGIAMVLTALIMAGGGIGAAYFAAKASICFTTDLRRDVFAKVQQFSFKNIDDFSTGSLVTRLTNDIQQMQNVIMMALRMMLRAPGMLIGALIMAFVMNAKLALVILVVIPLLTAAIVVILRTAFPRFQVMQEAIDKLNSGIQEALTNVRVIKSFVREDHEEEKFAANNSNLMDKSLKAMNIVIATMPVMMLAMNITTLAVVWYGGNMIIGGTMQVGDLTAFTTYIVQILMSLMMLSMVILQSSREEKGMVLEHITFTANPGETIGIIGSTGSGKTSLVQLIPRLYDATGGRVLVDGIDVKDYSLEHLREGVGMVLQKNVLFSGTIEENLRWGNEDASTEEIRQTADSAQADGFVTSFPQGYKTEMGQGGVNVSGGQKQRLCIARALLKKPKILILDDSTSAVDTATEARIQECFKTSLKDTTKIIIAQRIGSVENADRILVLDDGKIEAIGTHQELLQNSPAYQEIYY